MGSSFCRQIRAGEVYGGVDAGPLNEENEDSVCTSSIKDLERQPKKPYMYNSRIYVLKNRYTSEETLRKDVLDVDW